MSLTLKNRAERLERLIALEAPAVILAFAFHLLLKEAERLGGDPLRLVLEKGKKLESEHPEFRPFVNDRIRDENLNAAGFCTVPVANGLCRKTHAPDSSLCAEHHAEYELDEEDDDDELSPEMEEEFSKLDEKIGPK